MTFFSHERSKCVKVNINGIGRTCVWPTDAQGPTGVEGYKGLRG